MQVEGIQTRYNKVNPTSSSKKGVGEEKKTTVKRKPHRTSARDSHILESAKQAMYRLVKK